MTNPQAIDLDDLNLDELNFDTMLGDLADVSVVSGFDGDNDDGCEGGACKI
ncbi:hypothetical protein IM753_05835 [Moraxella sp. K127]|uniref:hypothetical protein n=1 Tax=Moraxella sp. K127 TaxID=2780079 RepID=UPI0018823BD2|nr:hypothetical protein [Moraxella sp. K127]MBE9590508.1 hypothetical protein [Moraxella sp. K127]